MGIFDYEIVLRDIPFIKKQWARKDNKKISAGSLTPWKSFSVVNDPTEIEYC
jgi:hypothetical protein